MRPRPLPIAEVVFNLPLERAFHYTVPPALRERLAPGQRVAAPFGHRELIGVVTKRLGKSAVRELKPIRRVIDPVPLIAQERWALAEWMARYYYCSLGEALAAMVPSALRLRQTPETVSPARPEVVKPGFELTEPQRRAWRVIQGAVSRHEATTLLLHGVTGSGKTELYLLAIEASLAQGRGALCLVPEIAITPQTIDRFRERFGSRVAVWHSRLTGRQRAEAWRSLLSGACDIGIGTRSAVFLPVARLGLVILDEEHDPSYKQQDAPRYHAREVAKARAKRAGALVMLGSATPSIESYQDARGGGSTLLELPERVKGRPLPRVDIIDMRQEMTRGRRAGTFSTRLELALQETVERGQQAMLLLNRRGFARVAQCPACGTVSRCARCSVPLVYHADRRELVCHYCSFHQTPQELCSACRRGYLRFRGLGTERVESELHRLFPAASINRMDADTTRTRQSHRRLYDAVRNRQIGLLVGTQMIAKGFDFPDVTLVGVVSADTALNLPDFRAGERTFSLLAQMAGRAGRGEQAGRVVIQTYCPTHYAIQAAGRHDYEAFFAQEIQMRKRLGLPPWNHLIELTVRAGSCERAQEAAEALSRRLHARLRRQRGSRPMGRGGPGKISVLGPAPHRVHRLRRTYRECLVLKGPDVDAMTSLLRRTLEPGRRFRGVPVTVDVDPV